jgi:hypothetical protein
MPRKLVRHGTNSGYRAELGAGNEPCRRCHNAHLVYQTQYTKEAKAKGLKYKGDQVIDHLYGTGTPSNPSRPTHAPRTAEDGPSPDFGGYTVGAVPSDPEPPTGRDGPTLLERIAALRVSTPDNDGGNEYVEDSEYPDYITPNSVDPDPDPDGADYSQVPPNSDEYVINAAGMAKIEDSLGTYLSIFGITMEMVDPYCGPILAENMDNIVRHWSKVIAKYPKAAELFMDGKGGTLMTWIGAIQATWPFLFAIYQHHFSKDIQTSGGNIYKKNANGAGRFDPTMPPMNDDPFQYTAG